VARVVGLALFLYVLLCRSYPNWPRSGLLYEDILVEDVRHPSWLVESFEFHIDTL